MWAPLSTVSTKNNRRRFVAAAGIAHVGRLTPTTHAFGYPNCVITCAASTGSAAYACIWTGSGRRAALCAQTEKKNGFMLASCNCHRHREAPPVALITGLRSALCDSVRVHAYVRVPARCTCMHMAPPCVRHAHGAALCAPCACSRGGARMSQHQCYKKVRLGRRTSAPSRRLMSEASPWCTIARVV